MSKMVKEKIKIEGMDCSSCALLIDGDLEDMDGICRVQTKYNKSELEVEYDQDIVKLDAITAKLQDLGYKTTQSLERSANVS